MSTRTVETGMMDTEVCGHLEKLE